MKYKAPEIANKPCYVPVVVKNKDFLLGYLYASKFFKLILNECSEKLGIYIDTSVFDACLDSTRFNDIMMNGKRTSECSQKEIEDYIKNLIENKYQKLKEQHPDNEQKILNDSILKIECPCGLGFYSYDSTEKIP